jgi:hypothetical protein
MITVTNNGVQQINAALFALDREIQNVNNGIAKIQKLIDGIDLGVVSVNDKTGKVELTAEDVGALPSDTHIPTDPVQSNWTETDTSSLAYIKNKPNLATVATSGSYGDLSNKPTIPAAQVNSDWNATSGVAEILHKPNLAAVATSGSYNDLSNKPTIPAAQVNSDWNATSGVASILNKPSLASVATSGSYNDLSNKPTIPTATTQLTNDSGFTTLVDVASLFFGGNLIGDVITDTYPPRLGAAQFKIYNCISINSPYPYGQLLSFGGHGGTQVFLAWNAAQSVPGIGDSVEMLAYMRSWRDISSGWTAWKRFNIS